MVARALIGQLALLTALACAPAGEPARPAPRAEAEPVPAPAEPTSAAARLCAQRDALRTRLAAELASGLGPRMAAELNRMLASIRGEDPAKHLPLERGWLPVKMARTFLALNAEWAESPRWTVELDGPQVATIVDLQRQLAAGGVELLVVPIPMRLNVEPDILEGIAPGECRAGCAPGLARWMLALSEAGVEVLDLLPELAAARASGDHAPDQLYLEDDGHWGPDGVRIAAECLARELRGRPWFPSGVAVTSRLERARLTWTHPMEERYATELEFDRALGPDGQPLAPRDRRSPVVLLGDSFTLFYEDEAADFARQLGHLMGFAPDVIAIFGGGAETARAAFARRADPLAGKRVVVWVFPPWALRNQGWEPIPLGR